MPLNLDEKNNLRNYIQRILGPSLNFPKENTLKELEKIHTAFTTDFPKLKKEHPYYFLRAALISPEETFLQLDEFLPQKLTINDVKEEAFLYIKESLEKIAEENFLNLNDLVFEEKHFSLNSNNWLTANTKDSELFAPKVREVKDNIKAYIKVIIGPYLSFPKEPDLLFQELEKVNEAFTTDITQLKKDHPYYILRASLDLPDQVFIKLDRTYSQIKMMAVDVKKEAFELIKNKLESVAKKNNLNLKELKSHGNFSLDIDSWLVISTDDYKTQFSTKPLEVKNPWDELGSADHIHKGRLYVNQAQTQVFLAYEFSFPDGERFEKSGVLWQDIPANIFANNLLLDITPHARRYIQKEATIYILKKFLKENRIDQSQYHLTLENEYFAGYLLTDKFYYQQFRDGRFPWHMLDKKDLTADIVNFLLRSRIVGLLDAKIFTYENIFQLQDYHLQVAGLYFSFLKEKKMLPSFLLELKKEECEMYTVPVINSLCKNGLLDIELVRFFSKDVKSLFLHSFYSQYLMRLAQTFKEKNKLINWWAIAHLSADQVEFLKNKFITTLVNEGILLIFDVRHYTSVTMNEMLNPTIQSLMWPAKIISPAEIKSALYTTTHLIKNRRWICNALKNKIITIKDINHNSLEKDLFVLTSARRLFAIYSGSPHPIDGETDSVKQVRNVIGTWANTDELIRLVFNKLFVFIQEQIQKLPKNDLSAQELNTINFIFHTSMQDGNLTWPQVFENILVLTQEQIHKQESQQHNWLTLYRAIESRPSFLQQFFNNIIPLRDFFPPQQVTQSQITFRQ